MASSPNESPMYRSTQRSSLFDSPMTSRFDQSSTTSSHSSDSNKPAVGMDIEDAIGGGLKVLRVKERGPADLANISPGDVIVSVGGRTVHSRHDYKLQIRRYVPGSAVSHVVKHPDGRTS